MEKVFLTGGTGMIGTPLLRALLEEGYEVSLLTRQSDISLRHKHLSIVTGDITDESLMRRHIAGAAYVLHLAAYNNANDPQKAHFVSTNVEGTRAVLQACVGTSSIKKIVCVSSIVVFRESGDALRDEKWPLRDSFENAHYSETKKASLLVTREFAEGDNALPIVTVFPTAVISEDDFSASAPKSMPLLQRLAWSKLGGGIPGGLACRVGDGRRIMNIVSVSDVVGGIIGAALRGTAGEDYILGGTNMSKDAYLEFASRKVGVAYSGFRIPLCLIKLLSILPGAPSMAHVIAANNETQCNFSSEKANRDFGYRPQDFTKRD